MTRKDNSTSEPATQPSRREFIKGAAVLATVPAIGYPRQPETRSTSTLSPEPDFMLFPYRNGEVTRSSEAVSGALAHVDPEAGRLRVGNVASESIVVSCDPDTLFWRDAPCMFGDLVPGDVIVVEGTDVDGEFVARAVSPIYQGADVDLLGKVEHRFLTSGGPVELTSLTRDGTSLTPFDPDHVAVGSSIEALIRHNTDTGEFAASLIWLRAPRA